MRILFCNYEYPPLGGGGGIVNALLAEELAKRHDVAVLTSRDPGLPAESIENGVRVLRVPVLLRRERATASFLSMAAYLPMGYKNGRTLLRTSSYDIINTHFVLPSGPVGHALSRACRIPNVLSVHGGDLYDPSKWSSPHRHWLLRAWVRHLLLRADHVVGQSSNTLDNVRRFYAPELKPTRIPLGIRRPSPGVARRDQYGLREQDRLLVTVGRLIPRKGLDQLIHVIAGMRLCNAHLLVLGTGFLEQKLRDQAQDLNVSDRVHFLGHVSEVDKFRVLRMSDAFVSTSQHEGFGLVFLEGMACGLPVICYDHGGQTDFLEDTITGYLVRLNDRQALEDRCLKVLQDRPSREGMGKENLRRVEAYYIDQCAQKYELVFEQVVATRTKNTH